MARVLLLALFVAGQGGLAFHHHGSRAGDSLGAASWRKALPANDGDHCAACELSSVAHSGLINAPAAGLAAEQATDVVDVIYPELTSDSLIRLTGRAPPSC